MLRADHMILEILNTRDPQDKCLRAKQVMTAVIEGKIATHETPIRTTAPTAELSWATPPKRPGRPSKPNLISPENVPKRSEAGRAALLHALAHIELNAIDLAFDMALRFTPAIEARGLDSVNFQRDWIKIGAEEAYHFTLVCDRMAEMGINYGDLPAHDGLWEAAIDTNQHVLARLAIAPMVLEARGLDVTPAMIEKLRSANDHKSADILQTIYNDEIGHVATGNNWFRVICQQDAIDPASTFANLVKKHFPAGLKSPFNHAARQQAGIELAFYQAWVPNCNADLDKNRS